MLTRSGGRQSQSPARAYRAEHLAHRCARNSDSDSSETSHGFVDDAARRARGVGADIIVRSPDAAIMSFASANIYPIKISKRLEADLVGDARPFPLTARPA